VAEVLSSALGLVLEPAQVTTAEVRVVLPATIGYDLVLCPFVLYLVMLCGSVLAEGLAAGAAAIGIRGVPTRSEHPQKRQHRPHQPHLARAAARDHHHDKRSPPRARVRFRPANGVAGSASGLRHSAGARSLPHATPSLRLAGSRRGDGAIGNYVGSGSVGRGASPRWQPGRHPGMLTGASRQFRPRSGEAGGSATARYVVRRAPSGPGRGQTPIRFGGHRGDGALGRALGSGSLAPPRRPAPATPRLRPGTGRSALTTRGSLPRAVPKVQFRSPPPPAARRPAAVPRFRHSSRLRLHGSASGLVSGGVLGQSTFRTVRQRAGAPRVRFATGRRGFGPAGGGMLGGSGRSPLRGPTARIGKQPRFGYGRRSLLSFLTGRRVGGSWLARKRVGSRSGVWLIGKRTGGLR
jgi:hypothetical protein